MKMPASFAEFSDALQKARIKDGSFCKNELTCIHYNGLTHAMIGWNANLYDLNLFAQRLASLTEEQKKGMDEHQAEPSDWAIRMCEAFVARSMGFTDRVQWTELLRQKGETLFTFDWKSGSVSDHVVQWCKENNRNWRYSHLGELQVAHGGEWRKVDYFCRDGSETRVYFPPEPVQEQQLHALAEAPAVHLRDLLTLGLPDHDVYLVHAAEDVGWVPAADLPRLTAQGKEEFSALLDAKIAAIRPGPYGVELVLDGVNSQLLAQYDETLANSSRAEHAMELFL